MTLKNKLNKKKLVLGTWLTLPQPAIAEMISRAGFDWMAIDLEHSTMTLNQAEDLIRTIDLMQKTALVRLPENNATTIKKVMDAGAHGIIVPMIKTLDDVKLAHQSLHYPPIGNRGVGLARAQKYGVEFKEHWSWLETQAILIVQIEHKDALENLDAIFSSGLIDGYIIGPYDLSASLGVPGQFDHPTVLAALKTIEEKADKHKINKGVHLVEMDSKMLQAKIKEGYNIIAYGVDFRVIEQNFRNAKASFDMMTKDLP